MSKTNLRAPGFTFYICFGKYAGFNIFKKKILLGWVSIAFAPEDLEVTLANMVKAITGINNEFSLMKDAKYTVKQVTRNKSPRPTAFPEGTVVKYAGIPCLLLQDTPYYSESYKSEEGDFRA